jgi:hypothetical protein
LAEVVVVAVDLVAPLLGVLADVGGVAARVDEGGVPGARRVGPDHDLLVVRGAQVVDGSQYRGVRVAVGLADDAGSVGAQGFAGGLGPLVALLLGLFVGEGVVEAVALFCRVEEPLVGLGVVLPLLEERGLIEGEGPGQDMRPDLVGQVGGSDGVTHYAGGSSGAAGDPLDAPFEAPS